MGYQRRMYVGMLVYALALAGVGLAMMVFGVYRGEVEQVFTKGIQICLECIGIG